MMARLKNLLLALICLVMLGAFALAVPSGMITPEAQRGYLDEAPSDEDDEYAFLFE